MVSAPQPISFQHIHNTEIRKLLADTLADMATLLAQTSCTGASNLADALNERKKQTFTALYAIGHETMDRSLSEEVLKAIRVLQDAFARLITAVAAMAEAHSALQDEWLPNLT